MATFAAGSSMLTAASCTKISSASFPSTNTLQKARASSLRPLAGFRWNSENVSRSALGLTGGRRIGESKGLGLGFRGIGSDGGCQFGVGVVPREAGRKLSSGVVTHAGKGGSVNAAERILAALGYVLPFFDGIQYGRYFFMQFPLAEGLLRPLFPLLSAYKGFPYSNFIAFFSLYLLVVRNSTFSRYVRFNAMQAVVLDVLLILPTLVERTFGPRGGIGLQLLIIFYNTVFLFLVSCFLFGVFSCLLGKTPRLPIVADAADQQIEG